jgi:hypothetical protein
MADRKFQRTAAVGLLLLLTLPGPGAAQLLGAEPALPVAPADLPGLDLAAQATAASLAPLRAPGAAPELARLQPTLEDLLRFYAHDRGLDLTPPRTPSVDGKGALAPALQALAALRGRSVDLAELERAGQLPDELQQALARIVLAYVEAAQRYTAAIAGLTMADLQRLRAGQPALHPPDGGQIASAALLVDRAIRESTPALRKWALLMAIEERSRHPSLRDATPDALLRAGAVTQDLRDEVDLASALRGWQPVEAHFQADHDKPSEALAALYEALGIPVFLDDALGFSLLDQQPQPLQDLLVAIADASRQGAGKLREAAALVSPEELDAVEQRLRGLDLEQLAQADPQQLDLAELEGIVEVLERADEALGLRLQAAALMSEAMAQARGLAPDVVRGLRPEARVESADRGVGGTPVKLERTNIPGTNCFLGSSEAGAVYLDCSGQVVPGVGSAGNVTLENVQPVLDENSLSLSLYDDMNQDGRFDEDELLVRTPPLKDAANHILVRDPYGYLLVGDEDHSVYDNRYGFVNVSLRLENGTIRIEHKYTTEGPASNQIATVTRLADQVLRLAADTNFTNTVFENQQNGFFNLTMNPYNMSLAIVDLGGDDVYTMRPGGVQEDLYLYNSSLSDGIGHDHLGRDLCLIAPQSFGFFGGVFGYTLGDCREFANDPSRVDQVFIDPRFNTNVGVNNQEGKIIYLNATNLSVPVRLSVLLDTSGNDAYLQQSPLNFSFGAADGGVGLFWDAERCQPGAGSQVDCPVPTQGHDVYAATNYTMGSAINNSLGLFLDEAGDDTHVAINWSEGHGLNRGVGIAVDLDGDDQWSGGNYTMGSGGYDHKGTTTGGQLGPSSASTHALTTYHGLGLLLDRRGDDAYAMVNRSSNQGKGWPALGLLLDLGGNDRGLAVNFTATGEFGTLGVGLQAQTLTAATTSLATNGWFATIESAQGGGLVLDAEVPDTAALSQRATGAESNGVGLGATEVHGDTGYVACPKTVNDLVSSGGTRNNCQPASALDPAQVEYLTLSRQPLLLRVPGLFGLGGVLSNDGQEAPVATEEHMLHIDLAGNDVYRAPFAGAALPNLTGLDTEGGQSANGIDPPEDPNMAPLLQAGEVAPVMVAVDVQGSDLYDGRQLTLNGTRRNVTTPTLGGGYLGIGLLEDVGLAPKRVCAPGAPGTPASPSCTTVERQCAPPVCLDLRGRDYRGDASVPPPCRRQANDVYVAANRSLGYGALYGVGALVDAEGDDCYVLLGGDEQHRDNAARGLGVGKLGGVGLAVDQKGDDVYGGGELSLGAGLLEPVNKEMPRRVSVPGSGGPIRPQTAEGNHAALNAVLNNSQLAFGGFLDARGHDRYAFANRSQGYGNYTEPFFGARGTAAGQTPPRTKQLAGLFVDDGFEGDTYAYTGPSPGDASVVAQLTARGNGKVNATFGHQDNSFWCVDDPNSVLNSAVAGAAGGAPEPARSLARNGPNQQAQCLRVEETGTNPVKLDLGGLGRGFDNLDFYANFLLALGTFGEEVVRARSVLSAPVVLFQRERLDPDTGLLESGPCNAGALPEAATPVTCADLHGTVHVRSYVVYGAASVAYNAARLLALICAKKAPQLADACDGAAETVRAQLVALGQFNSAPTMDHSMRRVEFWVMPSGQAVPDCPPGPGVAAPAGCLLLGVEDRRDRVNCEHLNLTRAANGAQRCDGVGHDTFNGTSKHFLLWDTAALVNGTVHPELRNPDGAYALVARAFFQLDSVPDAGTGATGSLSGDDQRYALNRLGDEYGFYPGTGTLPVVLDNPPLVYELTFRDVSRASAPGAHCWDPRDDPATAPIGPNTCLRLNLTVSPRLKGVAGALDDPPYVVRARLLRLDRGTTLAAEPEGGLACPAQDGSNPPPDFAYLETTCTSAAREEQVTAGFDRSVFSRLGNGRYGLLVDVVEPPSLDADGQAVGQARSATRCFVAHASPLAESPVRIVPENGVNTTFACSASFALDSITPDTVGVFDPGRTGADGSKYINASVAYPDPATASLHLGSDATVPLRFETRNAADKGSPVIAFRYRVSQSMLDSAAKQVLEGCFAIAGLDAPPVLRSETGLVLPCVPVPQPQGNLSVPFCGNLELFIAGRSVCLQSDDATSLDNATRFRALRNLVRNEVQILAQDLAGNTEVLQRAPEGGVAAEDTATLDVTPPEAVLCRAVPTTKTELDPRIPRSRTSSPLLPLPWEPIEGCEGALDDAQRDNNGVEAVLVAYNITAPGLNLVTEDLTRLFVPPADQQADHLAVFDQRSTCEAGSAPEEHNVSVGNATITFLVVGAPECELRNNRTLYAMARARDFAGNLQTDLLQVNAKVTFDDEGPQVQLLSLAADHDSAEARWFARDAEFGGRVARSFARWGPLDAETGLIDFAKLREVNATQVGTTARLGLRDLDQDTDYVLLPASDDDVGNRAFLPPVFFRTDPVARIDIASPRPGDVLQGAQALLFNVSDVRVDPVLTYNVSLVEVLPNGSTLALPVETFTRRECIPPEDECPTALNATLVGRNLQTARFPDSAQVYLRIAVNNSLNPGKPFVVSTGPFIIDNTPPLTLLHIVAQGGPDWFRSGAILVLEPTDNTTRATFTEHSFDNFTFTPYNASAPPVQDREGSIPFFFRSIDLAGNVEPLRTVSVNIDRQRPTGNLSIDLGAPATNDPNVTVFLQASDSLSGLANVTLDAGSGPEELDHPARFAAGRSLPVALPAGEGERRVRARLVDLAGNVEELKASIVVDTLPPEISGLHVDSVTHTTASLSWRTSEPSPSRVEYGPASAEVLANRVQADDAARAHAMTLTGLRPSTSYQFRVVGTDSLGNRAVLHGTFDTLPDVSPPGAPSSLEARDLGDGVVALSWQPAFDDVGIDHYVVYRGVAGQLDELARVAEAQFFDDTPIPGVSYDYAVQAVDLAGQPGPLSGLATARATTSPQLLEPRVSPDRGPASQVFTYSVVVRDADGDSPVSVKARISGAGYAMQPQFDGRADFSRGVLYTLAIQLPPTTLAGGFPTYQFEVSDGVHTVLAPEVPAAGPAVLGLGAVIPGLNAATSFFGVPGFEVLAGVAAMAVAALAAVWLGRRGGRAP